MNDPTPTVPPFGVVLTTLPDEAGAEALARQIVDAGLGACAQLQPIRSVYRWQGETCAEPEWRLAIKSTVPTATRRWKPSSAPATPTHCRRS
ncbi:divalent-cation tolerance protein CutA [Candidatus Skiveiella danica]|uniref:divalent-cation tolerance protein CutA n=1 Tax=Candidatus Skiveiella danica TaxID=3386177 RepID=UPI0039B8AEA5